MWSKIRNFWPVAALLALLWAVLGRRSTDKGAVLDAQEAAAQAQGEAIDAKSDLEKEKIHNEAEKKLADLAAASDDEYVSSVVDEYRRRHGGGAGRPEMEGPTAGGDDHPTGSSSG